MQLMEIIIVNYNNLKRLQALIESIKLTTIIQVRICVVDNGSTDGSREWLKNQIGIRYIFTSQNLGYSYALNQGIKTSKASYFICSNEDIEVTMGWDVKFREWLDKMEVGIVGPKFLKAPGIILNAGITSKKTFYKGRGHGERDIGVYDRPCKQIYACGAFLGIRKSVLEQIGFWDEGYFFYFDDVALSFAVKAQGYLVYYIPTPIYHFGSVNKGGIYEESFKVSKEKFEKDWNYKVP